MKSEKYSDEEFRRRLERLAEFAGDEGGLELLEKMVAERRFAENAQAWLGRKRVLLAWLFTGLAAGIAATWAMLGPFAQDVRGWFLR